MESACGIQYTFNWFFIDRDHIAYFNSGINPKRAPRAHPDLPTPAKHEWQGWTPPPQKLLAGGPIEASDVDPRTNISDQEPCAAHPQVVDQRYITSWNNKQAPGLPQRRRRLLAGRGVPLAPGSTSGSSRGSRARRRSRRPKLVDAMEDAGTVDLRGDVAVPYALELIGNSGGAKVQAAVRTLRAWIASGSHRRDKNADGVYDQAEAVRIIDAWWPRWLEAEFRPALGGKLFDALENMIAFHDAPGPVGSAFYGGWYGYVNKDLRTILGDPVRGKFSRVYCGGGSISKCRKALVKSLKQALAHTTDAELYPGGPCEGGDAQWCNDAVRHTATGAITQPPIHWINRPTFQQVVQIGE